VKKRGEHPKWDVKGWVQLMKGSSCRLNSPMIKNAIGKRINYGEY